MLYDVLIVGVGPSGLAVAARLDEPTPSPVFTDAEHVRNLQHLLSGPYLYLPHFPL